MKYHLIALFTVAVWGLTFVSTKVLLTSMTPLWILLLRFALGFIVLCVLRPHVLHMHERKHELLFVAAGATGIAAYYLLENIALVFTTATAVGVIVAVSPLFTAVLSAIMGDKSAMNMRFACGFVLAMTGLVLVSFGGGGEEAFAMSGGMDILGDLLALLAGLVWAIYSLLVRHIADLGYETIASTKRTFLWGLVLILPATLLSGESLPDMTMMLRPEMGLNLVFLGVVASAACFVTWGLSVKHLGATTSTTYIYLVPAITAAASIVLLGEPLTLPIVAGLVMTIGGLALSQSSGKANAAVGDKPENR